MSALSRVRWIAAAALSAALLSACAGPPAPPPPGAAPVGHGEMRFLGDWTGVVDRAGDGIVGMVITEAAADGTSFAGELTYAAAGAETTQAITGAMTPHGHLVVGVGGESASVEAHITDAATLDYCFVRYGFDPLYTCGRLERGD